MASNLDNLYLYSFVGDCSLNVFHHFMNHYRSSGIKGENFKLILQSTNENSENLERLKMICRFHGTPYSVYIGVFTSQIKKQLMDGLFKENNHLNSDWILQVDSDEFVCDILNTLNECINSGCDYATGRLVDRSADSLKEITPECDIWKTFPDTKELTKTVAWGNTNKIFLRKATVLVGRGHHEVESEGKLCHNRIFNVYHFKWDSTLLNRMKKRYGVYKEYKLEFPEESLRIIKHFDS